MLIVSHEVDFLDAIAPEDEAPEDTPGAILKVILDTDPKFPLGKTRTSSCERMTWPRLELRTTDVRWP